MNKSYQSYFIIAISLLLLVSIVRFYLNSDLMLTADEAHYALYAVQLDWSYFDHPPMVGWIQFLATALFGEFDWAFRIMPALLHMAIAIALFFLTLKCYRGRVMLAFMAMAFFEGTLMFQLMGMVMLPDTPLMLFTLLSVLCFEWAVRTNRWLAWLGYGVCLGLMGLSKYTAILVALSYFVWIAVCYPKLFLNVRLWLAALMALLLITPVIYWNIKHDWISFSYQLTHSNVDANQWSWLALLRAQAVNILAYGGLLVLTVWGVILLQVFSSYSNVRECLSAFKSNAWSWQSLWQKVRFQQTNAPLIEVRSLCKYIIIVSFIVFSYSSAQDGHFLPHWMALIFVLAIPFLSFQCSRLFQKIASYRRAVAIKSILVIAVCAILSFPFLVSSSLLNGKLGDELTYQAWRGVVGWKESTHIAKQIIQADEMLAQDATIYVANWSEASRVAWYARPLSVLTLDDRIDQYDLWFNDTKQVSAYADTFQPTKKGVLLAHLEHDELSQAMARFSQCDLLRKLQFFKYFQSFEFGLWKCIP